MTKGPLTGTKVLDFAGGLSGAVAAFLLADLGSDVVKVELLPRRGKDWKAEPVLSASVNRNKSWWARDLTNPEHVDALAREVARIDVVVGEEWVDELDAVPELHQAMVGNSGLVRASVLGLGPDPGVDHRDVWPDPRLQRLSGMARLQGRVLTRTSYIEQAAGISLAYAVLAALARRDVNGRGDSVQSSLPATALFLQAAPIAEYSATGHVYEQHEYSARFPLAGVYEANDGPFYLAGFLQQDWPKVLDAVGRPELVADPRFESLAGRIENRQRLREILEEAFSPRSRAEWIHSLEERGVMAGHLRDQRSLLSYEQLSANDVLQAHRLPGGGEVVFPRCPYRITENRRTTDLPATANPATSLLLTEELRPYSQSDQAVHPQAPLAGVRVVDLTHAVAGPLATQMLADLGADVWKLESPRGGDFLRGLAPYGFEAFNRGKRSVALDLKTDEGLRALMKMIERADVFIHSQRADVIEGLALTKEHLERVNQRLVHVGLSGFGDKGPERHRRGVDALIQAESGLASLQGGVMGNVSFVDQIAGCIFAFATLAGLRGRARTGRGCGVSVSLLDVAVFLQSSDVGRASLSAQVRDGSMPEQLFALSDDSVTAFEGPPMRDYADLLGDPEWAIYLETVSANGRRMALPVPPYALSSWRTRAAIGAPALGQDTNALFLSIGNDERQPIRAAGGVPEQ